MLQKPSLSVSVGQATSSGPKDYNDDFFGALLPEEKDRDIKGCLFALADGISTSKVGRDAAETCVKSFFTDYMAAPDSWTAKTTGSKVIAATNAWLHAQTHHAGERDVDRGFTCTLTAFVLKGRTAHIFHVGDCRLWRVSGMALEPLTTDHHARLEGGQVALSRAMGASHSVELDYHVEAVRTGDVFLMTTDGLHDVWDEDFVVQTLQSTGDLSEAAHLIVAEAEARAADNLTLQIIRVENLPLESVVDLNSQTAALPWPKDFVHGDTIDGLTIQRDIHRTHRSGIYLATNVSGTRIALKVPASEMRDDPAAIQRFVTEEWVARRINNPHVLSAPVHVSDRTALYTVGTFLEGQTLRQWMFDHPNPALEQVRDIISQIIKGLRAFHRLEMLHQDLRPENIMIDADGHVTLIDFGSAYVSGVQETGPKGHDVAILGTVQYSAPEYFSGEPVSWKADMFSLAVIAYEMLTGKLPYGNEVSRIRSPKDRSALRYRPTGEAVPAWLDHCLQQALHPDAVRRPAALSEFEGALRRPSIDYQRKTRAPLMERHPTQFWQSVSAVLAVVVFILLLQLGQ